MSNINKSDMRSALERSGLPMLKVAAEAPDDKSITTKPPKGESKQTSFLSNEMIAALSLQIGNEVFAAYSYHGASYWFDKRGFDGFVKLMRAQGAGEIEHARKIFEHLVDANAPFQLPSIAAPFIDYADVEEAVKAILEHEKSVTASWRKIAALALKDKDAATLELASFFAKEQYEEEKTASTLYDRVRMAGKDGAGLLVIDADLKG